MRSDRIPLPIGEPRCEPSKGCAVRSQCARALAAIVRGAPLADFTAMLAGPGVATCPQYVDVRSLRKQTSKRPVLPPIGEGDG